MITGNLLFVIGDEPCPIRAGTDQAHLAFDDVEDLRELVRSRTGTQEAADLGDAVIGYLCVGMPVTFCRMERNL